jgi:hypothetical protein
MDDVGREENACEKVGNKSFGQGRMRIYRKGSEEQTETNVLLKKKKRKKKEKITAVRVYTKYTILIQEIQCVTNYLAQNGIE